MIGDIYSTSAVSAYQPSTPVADFTSIVKKDYSYGNEILHRGWVELNGMSVIGRMNRDQKTFNAFVDETVEDESEAWKWRGTRSKARNKAVAMHSQLTAGYIIPNFLAQNEDSEEDRGFSDFMRDGIEWMVENSEYKSSFLMASMGMLVNPVTYMGAEFADVKQTIKEKTDKGFTRKEIRDEVLSGFKAPVYSADQILISNVYDQNIQRQRTIIKRRYIEWSEAKAKYEDNEFWAFVKPGIKTLYNDDDGLFYEVKDDDHPHLVEEVTYLNRREDTEAVFLNGIYMGDANPEDNAIKHRDNRNAPKYNVVPFGHQRINEHFFYYKSLMNVQYWDNQLLDAQYEIGMNRAFLDANMPIAVTGADKVDSDIVFPSAVIAFEDKDTKVIPLLPPANLGNMFTAMGVVEKSMDESSLPATTAGQLPDANQKATSVAIAERNAKILLQGQGKTLAESMVQFGGLMADIFINHYSIPEVEEMLGDNSKLKYRKMILKNKVVNGKELSKVLLFDEQLLGAEFTEEDERKKNLELLKDTGFPENNTHIYAVNPELFSRMKFLVNIEPEVMFPQNEEFRQAILTQVMAQFAQNPFVDLEALTQKTLYAFFRGESEGLLKRRGMQDTEVINGGLPQTVAGQQAVNTATGRGLAGVGV